MLHPFLAAPDCSTQLSVTSKPAEGTLSPTVHANSRDVKQHWSQYQPLRTPLVIGLHLECDHPTAPERSPELPPPLGFSSELGTAAEQAETQLHGMCCLEKTHPDPTRKFPPWA